MKSHLLLGGLTILIGVLFLLFPPRVRNGFYGYRTKRSFRSQESWDFAHHYSGKLMIWLGLLSMIIGSIVYLLEWSAWISLTTGFVMLIVVYFLTEEGLRNKGY